MPSTLPHSAGTTPIPDPTLLTTAALTREILAVKELMEEKFLGQQRLFAEKFESIQTQFQERDKRAEDNIREAKSSLEAAFQAAEKVGNKQTEAFSASITKSESAISKQIDTQAQLIATSNSALDGKIGDVKDRLTRIEGKGEGIGLSGAILVGTLGLILTILGIYAFTSRSSSPQPVAQPQVIYVPAPAVGTTGVPTVTAPK